MLKPIEHSIFGSSRIGIYKRGSSSEGNISLYELTDHLGNVRAVITKTPAGLLSLTNKTDYYPFGEPMPNKQTTDGLYSYAFQGQEKDGETGMEAFELRLWDGRIGRWLTVDPYRQFSTPYSGMGNNPISGIDTDGGYAYTTAGMPFRASTITPAAPSPAMTYYTDRDQTITYNVFKSPITITEQGKENIDFEYNASNGRSVMYFGNMLAKANRSFSKYYSAGGTMEIKRDILNNKVEFITYLGGDGYDAPIILKGDGVATPNYFYLHRDYQGSIVGITNSTAQVVEKRLFDAWGALIQYDNLAGATTPPTGLGGAGMFIDRGYTGHEHLLNVGLINMNGRIYDPKLHRFLQPDNNIQDPYNTQNYNRYGYVLNNPMKYTDPSGEFWNVIFGYIAAAYIYGAYGNGGELNPTKWDFSNPATYGAATQMISVYASVGMTNVANNYLQSYGVLPDLNATMGTTPTITNGTNDHSFVLDENSKNIQKSLLESNNNTNKILEEKEEVLGDRSHICTSGVLYAKPQITPKNMVFAGKMTVDWLTGSGPNRRNFNGGEIAEAMRDSQGVNQARNNYYATGKTENNYTFGLQGLRDAGWNPIQQFVGGYHYKIVPEGNQLRYELTNITSFSSAAYHIWPQSWNWENGPMGNTYQTYIFYEPIRRGRFNT